MTDPKVIRKKAHQLLQEGLSKEQVFLQLAEEHQNRKELAKVITNIPSPERWQKYGVLNTLLLVLLVLVGLAGLLQPTFGLIWIAALIYLVALKKFQFYYFISLLGAVSLISFSVLSVIENTMNPLVASIVFTLSLIFLAAGFALPRLLTPDPMESKEVYLNSQGEQKMRISYQFVD